MAKTVGSSAGSAWLLGAIALVWWYVARRAAPLTAGAGPAASTTAGAGALDALSPTALVYVAPTASGGEGYVAQAGDVASRIHARDDLGDSAALAPPDQLPYYRDVSRIPDELRLVRADDAGATPDPWRDELVMDYAAGRLQAL